MSDNTLYWQNRTWQIRNCELTRHIKWRDDEEHRFKSQLQISVVLDFEARYDFGALRTLIVCKDQDFLGPPVVDECGHFTDTTLTCYRPTRRSLLITKSERTRQATSTASSRVCTIIFELTRKSVHSPQVVEIPAQQSEVLPSSQLRVVYESLQPITPDEPSMLFCLSIDKLLVNLRQQYEFHFISTMSVCNIRVLPVSPERRSRCKILPPQVISLIVDLAIKNTSSKHKRWQSALLDYSLVQKSWGHVLGFFFESFQPLDEQDHSRVDIGRILRPLRWRPYYGTWIKSLTYDSFAAVEADSNLQKWRSFLEIITYTKSLRYLEMPSVPVELVEEAVPILGNLRDVCEWSFDPKTMDISVIRAIVSHWHQLEVLNASKFGSFGKSKSKSNRWLALKDFPNHTVTGYKLSNLNLESVKGSNTEFRLLLSAIAPSVTHITLSDCSFTCSPGEEFALDTVIPDMKLLENLTVIKSDVSILSIIRKPPAQDQSSNNSATSPRTTIKITEPPGTVRMEEIEDAIPTTHWNSVRIDGWKIHPRVPLKRSLAIVDVARARGVQLALWSLRSS